MSYCLTEYKFPELARLAKKFFGVPASEAEVETMFNISGHIFNPKLRSFTKILSQFSILIYIMESIQLL